MATELSGNEQRYSRSGLIMQLALRDYRHEWVMSGCFVLALAAVLVPLLVLFGLKHGIISNLLDPIKNDPRYREIQPSGSGHFGKDWFERMRQHPDVAFVVPRTRSIAAVIKLRTAGSTVGRIIDIELIPSAPGDPVLTATMTEPVGYNRVLLSASAAARLNAKPGTHLDGIISRVRQDEQETVILPLEVIGVSPAGAFNRDGLFVSVDLLIAIEDFRDGRAVPALGWEGSAPRDTSRDFAGFRLYAQNIDMVDRLRTDLLEQGIDVRTQVADIELVKKLDRNLSILFWIIAITAVTGYCFSLGSSIWANIDRKRRDFSFLRLVGFQTRDIAWFPVVQTLLTGLLGWTIAFIAYFMIAALLNTIFSTSFTAGEPICRLLPWHFVVTLIATLIIAALPAGAAGVRLAQMEPSRGLRDTGPT
jgi:putative ABC transport system permease protein